ncbi:hypothetical protein MSG28_013831 [Choristoneura fumiferana]|uniref:Uncharacterized protein n=1 Tax=Choristoneura fumiferana TaxID=7141 RepID=A0ACC0K8U5_CHOFU|nr:hypothetical protein MSG28_013831 [Choristoneura fumiferana]
MKKTSPPGKLRQFSFIYVWTSVQHCILHHADDILVFLSEQMGLDWFVCQMCSEKRDCSEAITEFPETALVQQASVYLRPRLRHHAAVSLKRGMHSLHSTGWVSGVLGSEALAGGAWLAALPCLVALPAAPFFAVLADSRGRKTGALCICLSFILSWSLAAWCGARGIWAARVAAGVGAAGAFALAPLYAGGVLSAHTLSLSMAAPPAVLLVSLVWLPETPSYLISDAAKVICWLDGSDFREDLTDAIEQQEVMIRTEPSRRDSDALTPMLMRSRSEGTSEGTERSPPPLPSCAHFLLSAAHGSRRQRRRRRQQLRHRRAKTVSRGWQETAETGSVLCGTALVLGAAVATATVDRLGRKHSASPSSVYTATLVSTCTPGTPTNCGLTKNQLPIEKKIMTT